MDKPIPISDMRQSYLLSALEEEQAGDDPLALFRRWFDAAAQLDPQGGNAMSMATTDAQGRPTVRVLLLKGVDADEFVFFTNYESDKAEHLARNPHAALCFWWPIQERQVRVEGAVRRAGEEESDAYFRTRPRESQIGAVASDQSRVVPSRVFLEQRFAQLALEYAGKAIPRPTHWGGYRLRAEMIEFWQGRQGRLHDRLRYRRADGSTWHRERLAP